MKKALLLAALLTCTSLSAIAETAAPLAAEAHAEETKIITDFAKEETQQAQISDFAAEGAAQGEEAAPEAVKVAETIAETETATVEAVAETTVVTEEHEEAVEEESEPHATWGYDGHFRAAEWGGECASGSEQSPINISQYLQKPQGPLSLSYKPTPLHVVNNGHTVMVKYEGGSDLHTVDESYALKKIHFHTPSEHYIDGAPYPLEAHFVHQAKSGEIAIVGVMFKLGAANPTIEAIWQNTPLSGGERKVEDVGISAADLLPSDVTYYSYDGSLTTPPCSEGVKWIVLKESSEISREQLAAFQRLYPVNARPVQPTGDRVITGE